MDGVLYLGDQPMPRLCEFFAFLRERPIPFILATNNSTRTPQEYVDKLAGMGVTVSPDEILVSGQATARFLAREYPRGTRVHVFGMPALKQAMTDEGFILADEDVQLVVASMDREVTFEKLKRATLLIRGGARFIATNLDPTNPSEEGLIPGTGAMIVALEAASETKRNRHRQAGADHVPTGHGTDGRPPRDDRRHRRPRRYGYSRREKGRSDHHLCFIGFLRSCRGGSYRNGYDLRRYRHLLETWKHLASRSGQ